MSTDPAVTPETGTNEGHRRGNAGKGGLKIALSMFLLLAVLVFLNMK